MKDTSLKAYATLAVASLPSTAFMTALPVPLLGAGGAPPGCTGAMGPLLSSLNCALTSRGVESFLYGWAQQYSNTATEGGIRRTVQHTAGQRKPGGQEVGWHNDTVLNGRRG